MNTPEPESLNEEQKKVLGTALEDLSKAIESIRYIRKCDEFGRCRANTPMERSFYTHSQIYEELLRSLYGSLLLHTNDYTESA